MNYIDSAGWYPYGIEVDWQMWDPWNSGGIDLNAPPPRPLCDTYWGSHGCDLPPGHEGTIHRCGGNDLSAPDWLDELGYPHPDEPCSEYNSATKQARYCYQDTMPRTWSEWDDCPAHPDPKETP